uniref:Uncharacterized protein n=1 Tax=Zea mays TaxID=4577 RepID=B6U7Q3_MAIZE|nr:hypothetical protein [Zea mays]
MHDEVLFVSVTNSTYGAPTGGTNAVIASSNEC